MAPSIITLMINMPLKFGSPGEGPDGTPMPLYEGQQSLQVTLLVIAFICIPWILLPKPFILNNKYKSIASHKKIEPNEKAPLLKNNNQV